MIRIIYKFVKLILKRKFVKRFQSFDMSSGVGTNGRGRDCLLSGTDRISIGKDSFFGKGTELIVLKNHFNQKLNSRLIIGNHVRCVGGCSIKCAGSIVIENDVLIGPQVSIIDHNHGMDPNIQGGYSKQSLIIKDIRIMEGVWIGQRVCILPGVTIGAHSIIGANSVVTHDIAPYTIAVGSPARVMKKWDNEKKDWIVVK